MKIRPVPPSLSRAREVLTLLELAPHRALAARGDCCERVDVAPRRRELGALCARERVVAALAATVSINTRSFSDSKDITCR